MTWLDNPAVQGGLAPLAIALLVGLVFGTTGRFGRTHLAWLAVFAGYFASTGLATGFSFSPLTATRKTVAVMMVAAVTGLIVDLARRRSARLPLGMCVAAALAATWTFQSIIGQREGLALAGLALGIASYAAAQTWLLIAGAHDGLRTGAVGVGLGVAVGVGAVLSASIGFLLSGIAVAAGSGALLLVQVLGRRPLPAGYTGALGIGLGCALFGVGAMTLAQLPWYALPPMLLIPIGVARLDPAQLRPMARAAAMVGIALALALLPIAAAWYAASISST
jgi:hypothetical protein